MFRIILIGFLLILTSILHAQTDTLSFENFKKYSKGISFGVNNFVQYYTDSVGIPIRLYSIKTRTIRQDPNNLSAVLIIQRYCSDKGVDADTAFVYKNNFEPVGYHTNIQSANYKELVSFSSDTIHTSILYKDTTIRSLHIVSKNYFLWTTIEDIMCALPLSIDYSIVIKNVNPGEHHSSDNFLLKVVRKDKIRLSDGSNTEVYVIHAGFPKFNNFSEYYISVDKHVLLKHTFRLKNGSYFIEEKLTL